ncbi:polysaccharide pyruvyl transferase family protein [Parasulfuritortus cantonensis]|uniref:Polysaccharide pyruvyl transferase family protein n=1 Tax=Parasulfuritortus cantonensis TaxID=2528202 RepID=A0A4R1BIK0_9PROT|nr:polysaccharide pyruvyl transferase family protein [Parasulfuritortus cantonensis]TCJ17099.1 polysaccharide pyruvyl transferase family protein [Parasulfuritortus cantonensis]
MAEPLILFGAFDRHNLGDILLGHIAAAEAAPRPAIHAGLAGRDLTVWGGHRVRPLPALAQDWGERPADLLHVGGELLTCSAYEAAVMLQTDADARAAIARYDADPAARSNWAARELGLAARLPYLAEKSLFRRPRRFEYRAVGGVAFDRLPPPARAEAGRRLAEADRVSVRERTSLGHVAGLGIAAELEADPVGRVAALFGTDIRRHAGQGAPAAVRAAFPAGYLAVQCAAECGDDAGLDRLAAHLDGLAPAGIVLFRAGAAPWHDDLDVYRRLAGKLPERPLRLFESLNVWDVCALLAGAEAYCGSSLHGGIVARAFGVTVLPFPLAERAEKQAAYWRTWA